MAQSILVERHLPVARLTLNRPEAFNAIDLPMAEELTGQLASLATDGGIRAVIITGAGEAFSGGGDLKWVRAFPDGQGPAFRALAGQFHEAIKAIRTMGKPVIAAINGIAAGGGFSLALACDFRVMSKRAVLRQAYTSSGLCIDGGGTFMLPRLVGLAKALEIAALDKPIDAARAQTLGMVSAVVNTSECVEAALKLANELAGRSLHSFAWSKQLINASFETSFAAQLQRELDAIVACGGHTDGLEGVRAFAEKRKPQFVG